MYVRFDESDECKRRPVLIAENCSVYVLAYKVTSHEPRWDSLEYEIVKWKSAGLEKESTIRLSQMIKLKPEDFDGYIGKLQIIDRERIENILA